MSNKKWAYAQMVSLFESIFAKPDSPQDCQKKWLEAIKSTGWTDEQFMSRFHV